MVSIYLLCWFSFVLFLAGSLFHDVISRHLGHDNCNHNLDTQNVLITLEWVNHFGCFLGGRCKSGRWKCVQAGEKIQETLTKIWLIFEKVSESWSFTLDSRSWRLVQRNEKHNKDCTTNRIWTHLMSNTLPDLDQLKLEKMFFSDRETAT